MLGPGEFGSISWIINYYIHFYVARSLMFLVTKRDFSFCFAGEGEVVTPAAMAFGLCVPATHNLNLGRRALSGSLDLKDLPVFGQ